MLDLQVALLSETGGRHYNEDACGHWASARHLVCVVADGAGGHGGGDVASRLAVRHLISSFARQPAGDTPSLVDLVRHTNDAVIEGRSGGAAVANMHTTVVCLVIDFIGHRAHWAHAGDSRLYLFRDGRVIQRTSDHSLVQSLVDAGMLTPDELRQHPKRSELSSALGARPEDLEISSAAAPAEVRAGDAFLLCTDGLWELVEDHELEAEFARAATPRDWLDALERRVQEAARERASHDNFSALTVWLGEAPGERTVPRARL